MPLTLPSPAAPVGFAEAVGLGDLRVMLPVAASSLALLAAVVVVAACVRRSEGGAEAGGLIGHSIYR